MTGEDVENSSDLVPLAAVSNTTLFKEVDSSVVTETSSGREMMGVNTDANPATHGEGNSPTASVMDDVADLAEIELALRVKPEESPLHEEISTGSEDHNTLVEHDGTLAENRPMVDQQEVAGDVLGLFLASYRRTCSSV